MKKIAALALYIITGVAHAEGWTIFGDGNQSCGKWIADRRTDNLWFEKGQWVNGFLSGAGYTGVNLRKTDVPAVVAWLDKHCAESPLDDVADAAMALVIQLRETDNLKKQ